jgi:hypothetical protein
MTLGSIGEFDDERNDEVATRPFRFQLENWYASVNGFKADMPLFSDLEFQGTSIATVCYPAHSAHLGKNGLVSLPGQTHFGPQGEVPGAAQVRLRGNGQFPGVTAK